MVVRLTVKSITTLSPKRAPTAALATPRSFAERRVRSSLLRILQANELCAIATVTGGTRAHISHLYFAYSPDLQLYFLSDPGALHSRNLLANASMAVTVYSSAQPWTRPGRGVTLWGICTPTRGAQATAAARVYGKRFPEYARLVRESGPGFRYRLYRFVPRTMKILDEAEFGGGVFVVAALRRT